MKKYLAEFIGTFALVFFGTGAIIVNELTNGAITHVGIAITFGSVIMVMIYAFGSISGAHFNPAVTTAFALSGRFNMKDLVPYLLSQVAGALAASFVLSILYPTNQMLGTTMPSGTDMQSFILEAILTFFLMIVILHVATGSKEQGMFAGLAIGFTILIDAMSGGPISGASMNPARSLAPAIVTGHFEHLWLYIVAPVIGACVAVPVWKYLNK